MKTYATICAVLLFSLLVAASASAQTPDPAAGPQNAPPAAALAEPIQYNTLYASAHTELWQIDPYTGDWVNVGDIGYEGTDIAFDGKTLYGINFSQLLSIDPETGAGTVIGYIGYTVNALTVAPDGTMYAGGVYGQLIRIDKTTGAGTLIGAYGSGIGSSGDLAVSPDGKMYATITRSGYYTDWLALIDVNTGRATPIGDIGERYVYGIDFKDWSLYGVTSNGHVLEIDENTGASQRITTLTGDFWGLSTSGPALTGNITSPADGYTTGPASIPISAEAAFAGGGSVSQVEFYVFYDRRWHSLGWDADRTAPYTVNWTIPETLNSQQLLLRIDVSGANNQGQPQRASYAGGLRRVNYLQAMNNPNITEVWVGNRAYLNQRSLATQGDSKCNVSSLAMLLAMEGYINSDYLSMATKANALWPYLQNNLGVEGECDALQHSGAATAYCSGATNHADGWEALTALIDSGHPVVVDSRPGAVTTAGHYVLAVGYKESGGDRSIIAYDPYGAWRGTLGGYYRNTTEPASHVGKWIYYNFEDFTGDTVYLFAAANPAASPQFAGAANLVLSAPDQVSSEAQVPVYFDGTQTLYQAYLPSLTR